MHFTTDPYANPYPATSSSDPTVESTVSGEYVGEYAHERTDGYGWMGTGDPRSVEPIDRLPIVREKLYDLSSNSNKTTEELSELKELLAEYKKLTGNDMPLFMI